MIRLGFTKTQTPGNKYTKDWLIVLCEMVLCETKRNEIKSVLCEMKICNFMKNFYFPTIMTASSWCLVNADLKTWDRGKKKNNFSELVCREMLRRNSSTEHCAFSATAFVSWWTGFAFLRHDYINLISPRHPHYANNIQKDVLDLFVELILRDGSVQ